MIVVRVIVGVVKGRKVRIVVRKVLGIGKVVFIGLTIVEGIVVRKFLSVILY